MSDSQLHSNPVFSGADACNCVNSPLGFFGKFLLNQPREREKKFSIRSLRFCCPFLEFDLFIMVNTPLLIMKMTFPLKDVGVNLLLVLSGLFLVVQDEYC